MVQEFKLQANQDINPEQKSKEFINAQLGENLRLTPIRTADDVELIAPGLLYAVNDAIGRVKHLQTLTPHAPTTNPGIIIAKENDLIELSESVNENSLYGGLKQNMHFEPNLNAIFISESQLESFITEPIIRTHLFLYHLISNQKTNKIGFMDIPSGLNPRDYCQPGFYIMENLGHTGEAKIPGFKDNRNDVNATHNYSTLVANLISAENPHLVFSKSDQSGNPIPLTVIDRVSIENGFIRQTGMPLSQKLIQTLVSGRIKNINSSVLDPIKDFMKQMGNTGLQPFYDVIKLMSTTPIRIADIDLNRR